MHISRNPFDSQWKRWVASFPWQVVTGWSWWWLGWSRRLGMPNPTFAKEDSAAGTLDLETPPHTHSHTTDMWISGLITILHRRLRDLHWLFYCAFSITGMPQSLHTRAYSSSLCPHSTPLASHTERQQFSADQETTSAQPSKRAAVQLQLRWLEPSTSPCCLEICRRLRFRCLRGVPAALHGSVIRSLTVYCFFGSLRT